MSGPRGKGQLWCLCGAGALLPYGDGWAAAGVHGLRLWVRSGEWVGWRSAGGE